MVKIINYTIFLLVITFYSHFLLSMENDNQEVPSLKMWAAGAVIEYEPKQVYDFTRLPQELCKYVKDTYDLIKQVCHTVPPILFNPKISESTRTFLKAQHKKFLAWKKMYDEWRDVTFSENDLRLVEFVKKHAIDMEQQKSSPLYERGKALVEVLQNLNEYGCNASATQQILHSSLFMPLMAITLPHLRKKLSKEIWHRLSYHENNMDIMGNLLKRGFNINALDRDLAALHRAAINENFLLVKFLIEHGAHINITDSDLWINFLGKKYRSGTKDEFIHYLQEQGGVITDIAECIDENEALLFKVIKAHNYELVETLLAQDIPLPLTPYDEEEGGYPVFYTAAQVNSFGILSLLCASKRFKYKEKKEEYRVAFEIAQEKEHASCAQLLKARLEYVKKKEKLHYHFNVLSL